MRRFQPHCLCMRQTASVERDRRGIVELSEYKRRENPVRVWIKVFDDTHMIGSETIEDYSDETRTHKIFKALEEACVRLDLGKPIWLDSNVTEFKKLAKTRFYQDNFVEEIEFDYLELHVIEED